MYRITLRDRLLLSATVLLSAFQITAGIEGRCPLAVWSYTIGFGILLVACLLVIILGFEGFENDTVVIISTAIPLSISLGLVADHFTRFSQLYMIFCLAGFSATAVTRKLSKGTYSALVLALTHGIAGLMIAFLPLVLTLQGQVPAGYALVGLGGGLIGLGGLMLASLRAGQPVLSSRTVYSLFPLLLALMTASFIGGFSFG
jgi:hypothetical protein